ncbi:MAG: c-type cytochrome [Candidatus Tectimicrobiota bacterium]
MTVKIFSWLAGLTLVLVFLVIVSPDLFRGYVFSADARSTGQRTYETYCVGCHGRTGQGDGEAAVFLNPKPRNFVRGDYKYFHFSEPAPFPSDESLAITVRSGLPGSSMPAFPLLTDQELRAVIGYTKQLKAGGWVVPKPIQAAAEPVKLAGETGDELFKSAGCIGCHQFDPLQAAGGVGPNLSQVGSRLSLPDLVQSIVAPNTVIAMHCPAGPCPPGVMPQNYAERLSEAQIQTLATYLAGAK